MPKEGEITKRSFADEIASSRQDREDAEKSLNDAQRKYEVHQSKYEMHVFAAEVYRQYIAKKRKDDKVVHIDVGTYYGIREIRKDYRGKRSRARDIQKEPLRSGDLSKTETAIFLDTLDKYFGLKLTSARGGDPVRRHTPVPSLHLCSSGFYVTENKFEMNQEEEEDDDSPSSSESEIGR